MEISLLLWPLSGRAIPSSGAGGVLRPPMPVKPEDEGVVEAFVSQCQNGSAFLIAELSNISLFLTDSGG